MQSGPYRFWYSLTMAAYLILRFDGRKILDG